MTLLLLCSFLSRRVQQVAFYAGALYTFLLIALRSWTVGADTEEYMGYFISPEIGYGADGADMGFDIIVRLLNFISPSFPFINMCITALYMAGLYYLIDHESRQKMLSLFLFTMVGTATMFLHDYMTLLRQCVALSFWFFALYWLNRAIRLRRINLDYSNELWGFGLCFVAAMLNHTTVLIMTPFLLFVWWDKPLNRYVWLGALAGSYLLGVQSLFTVSDLFYQLFSLVGRNITAIDKYSQYGMVEFGKIEQTGSLVNMMMLPFTALAMVSAFFATRRLRESVYFQVFCLCVMMNNVFNDNLMWARLVMYGTMLVIIVLPNALRLQRWYIKAPFYAVVFAYFVFKLSGQFLNMITEGSGNVVIPYATFFNDLI